MTSGEKIASGICATGKGCFKGIVVMSDGTNAVTVNVYDSLASGGAKLIPEWVVTTSATDRTQSLFVPDNTALFKTGIYVSATTAGAVKYMVYYDLVE